MLSLIRITIDENMNKHDRNAHNKNKLRGQTAAYLLT